MGRPRKYKEGSEQLGIYLTPEEFADFEEIRWREHKDKTELGRIALLEYIKAHKSGNTTYKLDDFGKHPDLIAIPALMSNKEDLKKYVLEEYEFKEIEKVKEQAEFFLGILNRKLLNMKHTDPDMIKAEQDRNNRLRRNNDIRYKNPKHMKLHELTRYHEIMSKYTEEEKAKFLEEAQAQ